MLYFRPTQPCACLKQAAKSAAAAATTESSAASREAQAQASLAREASATQIAGEAPAADVGLASPRQDKLASDKATGDENGGKASPNKKGAPKKVTNLAFARLCLRQISASGPRRRVIAMDCVILPCWLSHTRGLLLFWNFVVLAIPKEKLETTNLLGSLLVCNFYRIIANKKSRHESFEVSCRLLTLQWIFAFELEHADIGRLACLYRIEITVREAPRRSVAIYLVFSMSAKRCKGTCVTGQCE